MLHNRHIISISLFLVISAGCSPNTSKSESAPDSALASEPQMHDLVAMEATVQVLKNVDRPFEATVEPGGVWIDPTDPSIAQCVMYCTHSHDGKEMRSLFLVVFVNKCLPNFATEESDLTCVLVNRDGTVLDRDQEFWDGYSPDELAQFGAVDTDGPPFLATGLLKMSEFHRRTQSP